MLEAAQKPIDVPRQIRDSIDATQYHQLLAEHFFDAKESIVRYYYFDTDSDSSKAILFGRGMRLRARADGQTYRLELKPNSKSETEVRQSLAPADFERALRGDLPRGEVQERLSLLGEGTSLHVLGNAESVRRKKNLFGGYCELDKTTYPDGTTVYRVEFRTPDSVNLADVRASLGLPSSGGRAGSKREEFFAHLGTAADTSAPGRSVNDE